jgi:hypothetical protein
MLLREKLYIHELLKSGAKVCTGTPLAGLSLTALIPYLAEFTASLRRG